MKKRINVQYSKQMKANHVLQVVTCECNGKTYASRATFNAHQKSDKHQLWSIKDEIKKLREELTRKEIILGHANQKIIILKKKNSMLKNLCKKGRYKKRRNEKLNRQD